MEGLWSKYKSVHLIIQMGSSLGSPDCLQCFFDMLHKLRDKKTNDLSKQIDIAGVSGGAYARQLFQLEHSM